MTDRDDSSDDSSEGFLERWSRKKIEAEREAPQAPAELGADGAPPPDEPPPSAQRAADSAKSLAPTALEPGFDLASLPSLETITAATDIRAFLAPGVPKELARAALRRAWAADPAIRDFVGLAENAWDFTDPTAMPGFSALPPGYDVKKLVAQIFSGSEKPADPAVSADEPAGPQAVDQAAHIAEEIAPQVSPPAVAQAGDVGDEEAPPDAPTGERQAAQSDLVQRNNTIAMHNSIAEDESDEIKNRRQHGGALPQ